MIDQFLLPTVVAERLAVSPETLRTWRERGKGPRAIKVIGQWRYREADVAEWLNGLAV
ncbi:MAG: helix-turn-helix domain-containing protein [Anaerolineae bacterium]|nr:helix-turn-helix domain-containing protein [Caldilineaceae bacterium]MCB0255739.1 helix-turn-helix domain-containing protein [Anaerolineae bacterium]